MAIQRLRTLLATLPDDVEVRSLLASVYRQTGNPVEAGRWGFLSEDVRPSELSAFTKANPDPWQRLRLLQFSGDPSGLGAQATERLVQLAEEAQQSGPPTQYVGPYRTANDNRSTTLPCLYTAIVLIIVTALAGIGAIRIIAWLLD